MVVPDHYDDDHADHYDHYDHDDDNNDHDHDNQDDHDDYDDHDDMQVLGVRETNWCFQGIAYVLHLRILNKPQDLRIPQKT